MSWQRIEPPSVRKASQISITLSVIKGKGRIIVSVPSAVAAQHGFEKSEHANVFMGDSENAGKVWIAPNGNDYKIGRLKHCVTVRPACPPGVTLRDNSATVDYEPGPNKLGIIFTLPTWLTAATEAQRLEATGVAASEKPGSLEIKGNLMTLGAKTLSLTKSESIIMRLLDDNWGSCVRKQQILDELYSLDPNGGAEEKIIDVWIHKLRKKFEDKQMDLIIVTHRGTGYELRRAVA